VVRRDHSQVGLSERNTVTLDAQALFENLIEKLAEFDRVGFPFADDISRDAFAARSAFEMISYTRNNFSMLTIFDRFRCCELELPASQRRKLGPRLDFSEAKTYADAAQTTLEAMILAGLPHVPGAYV
jgi:hypothetical protein